jgi:hypothetical protein
MTPIDHPITPSTVQRNTIFAVSVLLLVSGCVIRTRTDEIYLGPILFRFSDPSTTEANVVETKHLGLVVEAGTQWGLSLGISERTAVSPYRSEVGEKHPPRWNKPLSLTALPKAGEWSLSFFYLRGVRIPEPVFINRSTYGASVLLGNEANSVSLGVVNRTLLRLPPDTLVFFNFDSRYPLGARMKLLARLNENDTFPEVIEEVKP